MKTGKEIAVEMLMIYHAEGAYLEQVRPVRCIAIYTEQRSITSSQAVSLLTQIELHGSIQFRSMEQTKAKIVVCVLSQARRDRIRRLEAIRSSSSLFCFPLKC
jgi:hypothetical protein